MKISEKLLQEWDYKKNERDPSTLTHGSEYRAWWTCQTCSHNWQTFISHRSKGSGCPKCAGRKNIPLLKESSHLEQEWDFRKNKKAPHTFTSGSSKKVWWICKTCHYNWYAKIFSRSKGSGCPKCAGRKNTPLFEESPHLEQEWNYKKNQKDPHTLTSGSGYKAWWVCHTCQHNWQTTIGERSRGSGCPKCAGFKYIPLFEKAPHLEKEWDFERNKKDPHTLTSGAGYKAWWVCYTCQHKWQTIVAQRTTGAGCIKCARMKRRRKPKSKVREETFWYSKLYAFLK